MIILNGKEYSQKFREELKVKVDVLKEKHNVKLTKEKKWNFEEKYGKNEKLDKEII